MQRRSIILGITGILLAGLVGCGGRGDQVIFVTATPDSAPPPIGGGGEAVEPSYTATAVPPPTLVPTPNPTRTAVMNPTENQLHTVQPGETLLTIAQVYGVSVAEIVQANGLPDENMISVGQVLVIPNAVSLFGPDTKLIPDSELVYGPSLVGFDTSQFVAERAPESFLAAYSEEVGDIWMSGPEIIERVALENSVSPRLLLALLEYESGWLSQSTVNSEASTYPMGYLGRPSDNYGLYDQMGWAANMLNAGYYGWRQRGLSLTLLADGTRMGLAPTLNAGTVGVQVLLAQTRGWAEWMQAVGNDGFYATYVTMFGSPFERAVEPLLPPDLSQPPLALPWAEDETWYYTGGPHGGWGTGSAWAALDLVPEEPSQGCEVSGAWVRAMADGVIARSERGIVILDLDRDGFEGTGWTIFYAHIATEGRAVQEGQFVQTGDLIGHPSCEGGFSNATHLHIARRYNGEWIAADCGECMLAAPAPQMNLDGWLAETYGVEYNGALVAGEEYRVACQCREPLNAITAPTASD
jgi:LasA protease